MSVKYIPPYTPFSWGFTWGFTGVYLFFLVLIQNIDCGYSLELFYRVPTINVLSINVKNIKIFPMKIFIFITKTFSVYCMGVFS